MTSTSQKPVIAYHLIITTYGFWLPNDPRGSGSKEVRAKHLQRFGPATHTNAKQSVAHADHDWRLRVEAKRKLRFAPVKLSGLQAVTVARGFQSDVRKSGLIVCACTIRPTHVHLVIAIHRNSIERISTLLKGAATAQLLAESRHPFDRLSLNGTPTPWTRRERSIFLDDVEGIHRSCRYADSNAHREGLRTQRWPFLSPLKPT